jgi:acyl carrier protein
MAKEELLLQLKTQIIKYLNLMDIEPEDIKNDAPLFGPESEIELDSIDAIELSVLMEREYDLKITDPKKGRKVMASVNVMADFIIENGKG